MGLEMWLGARFVLVGHLVGLGGNGDLVVLGW